MPETQPGAMQIAFAAGHGAAGRGAAAWSPAAAAGVELLPGQARAYPGAAATVAASRLAARRRRASRMRHRHAAVRSLSKSPVNNHTPRRPTPRPPRRSILDSSHSSHPCSPTFPVGVGGRRRSQRRRLTGTASRGDGLHGSAFVLVSGMQIHGSRGQRGVADKACTTSRSTPARTQFVAAVCRNMCSSTAKPQSLDSRSENPFAARSSSARPAARGRG